MRRPWNQINRSYCRKVVESLSLFSVSNTEAPDLAEHGISGWQEESGNIKNESRRLSLAKVDFPTSKKCNLEQSQPGWGGCVGWGAGFWTLIAHCTPTRQKGDTREEGRKGGREIRRENRKRCEQSVCRRRCVEGRDDCTEE